MLIVDVEQGGDEWLLARAGVTTASRVKDALKVLQRKSNDGRPAGDWHGDSLSYMNLLACEVISGQPLDNAFTTWQMRRGQELEPVAAERYEQRTGVLLEPIGLVLTEDRRIGYSPDRQVMGQRAGVEIKVPAATDKVAGVWIDPEPVIEEYELQVLTGLAITGWLWIDLVIYTPWLERVGKDLWVKRFHRDEDRLDELLRQIHAFNLRVDQRVAELRQPMPAQQPPKAEATPPWEPSAATTAKAQPAPAAAPAAPRTSLATAALDF